MSEVKQMFNGILKDMSIAGKMSTYDEFQKNMTTLDELQDELRLIYQEHRERVRRWEEKFKAFQEGK